MRIAVVGTGISGMVAARLLCVEHDVHVFEANDYVGGHTNTVRLEAFGRTYDADTGFMVFNDRTYPDFVRMLDGLGVPWRFSDMSFSVRCERTGLEYQGSTLNGLFAQRRNLVRLSFWRMLRDILRFNREARRLIGTPGEEMDLGGFLLDRRFGREFTERYLLPMGSAIWSCPPGEFRRFPMRYLAGFMHNHGLIQIWNRPQWKTVCGGAVNYVEPLTRPYADRIRLSTPVASVRRHEDRVTVTPKDGPPEVFDAVVLACHADQSLAMLSDASEAEREILSAFPYQRNDILLHVDAGILPRRRRAWASWNYHILAEPDQPVALTYNLNRLQGHESPEPLCETLNHLEAIDPHQILRRLVYDHPVYSRESIDAQRRYNEINGRRRTYFCGAYWGYGFHEDGMRSGLAVGRCFGKQWD